MAILALIHYKLYELNPLPLTIGWLPQIPVRALPFE